MADKRLLDYDTATEYANDDYILLDGSDGTKKILVSSVAEGGGSSEVKNPVYNWWTNQDETMVVRETIATGAFRWYLNELPVTTSFVSIPSNLQRFILNSVGCKVEEVVPTGIYEGQSYYEDGVAGMYDNKIRLWTTSLTQNFDGVVTAIIESTDSGVSYNNYHSWVAPTFDPING